MGYFEGFCNDKQLLKRHGFDHWPSEDELAEYLFETNDRMDAVCAALRLETCIDVRGRWHVYPVGKQGVR